MSEGLRDFDFLHGAWTVRHRRLADRRGRSHEWQDFVGTAETRPLLGGLANIEEHLIPDAEFSGVALRTFDPVAEQWSICWVSALDGVLGPAVIGRFDGEIGRFEGEDCDEGHCVRVRFLWDRSEPQAPRWEQCFSYDEGRSWVLNWIMEFRR